MGACCGIVGKKTRLSSFSLSGVGASLIIEGAVDVMVELGTEKFEARATVVESAEGDRLGSIQVQKLPGLAELAAQITRKVPVVLLECTKESADDRYSSIRS